MRRWMLVGVLGFVVACEGHYTTMPLPPGVEISPASARVAVGDTVHLIAWLTGDFPPGHPAGVTWTSSDPAVATVDTGVVRGIAPGTAYIGVRPLADTTLRAVATVTVH